MYEKVLTSFIFIIDSILFNSLYFFFNFEEKSSVIVVCQCKNRIFSSHSMFDEKNYSFTNETN